MSKDLETIIGLEIHVQLKTKTKMFCGCSNDGENQPPNTTVCEVCLGHPGTLPVPNKTAVEWSVVAAQALNCKVNQFQHFDRKNYFYPDLPKGYQISQLDHPIGEHGHLDVRIPTTRQQVAENEQGNEVRIGITRLHLEEDAAKNIHSNEKTEEHKNGRTKIMVDYNRGGTPLMEIVTEPDIKSPQAAKAFLQELRLIMRYLEVSDADMEKGHLRCDANISLRPAGTNDLYPKTEIKNLNSFKAVERALEYEIQRQQKMWEAGEPPQEQSTRGWDESSQSTTSQRSKEGSADYRYFPEPDIPSLRFETQEQKNKETDESLIDISLFNLNIPELPIAKRERFVNDFEISYSDAKMITEDRHLASYFESVVASLKSWLETQEELEGSADEIWEHNKKKLTKLVASWLLNKLSAVLIEQHMLWADLKITADQFAEFITLMYQKKLTSTSAQEVLRVMVDSGTDPAIIMEEQGMHQVSDEGALGEIIDTIINENPEEVKRYQEGKQELIKFFVGQAMKLSKGRGNPQTITELFNNKLGN